MYYLAVYHWYITLAGSSDILSVGADMWGFDNKKIDTTNDATTFANNVYNIGGYKKLLKLNPLVSDLPDSALNSAIIYIAGHGSSGAINLPYLNDLTEGCRITSGDTATSDYEIAIAKKSFSNTRIAIIAACNAGANGGFVDVIQQRGADASMGWFLVVDDTALEEYSAVISKHLGSEKTLKNAILDTNMDMLTGKTPSGDTIGLESTVFDYKVYGSIDITARNSRELAPKTNYVKNIDNLYYNMDKDYSEIIDYIQRNMDSNFDISNFEVYERQFEEMNEYVAINFSYKMGDFISDFGYTVLVKDGEIYDIFAIGQKLYNVQPTISTRGSLSVNQIKVLAAEENQNSDKIIEQVVKNVYDSKNEKAYYKVYTTYEDIDGENYCLSSDIDA